MNNIKKVDRNAYFSVSSKTKKGLTIQDKQQPKNPMVKKNPKKK